MYVLNHCLEIIMNSFTGRFQPAAANQPAACQCLISEYSLLLCVVLITLRKLSNHTQQFIFCMKFIMIIIMIFTIIIIMFLGFGLPSLSESNRSKAPFCLCFRGFCEIMAKYFILVRS
jgi:hypothetical protein